MIQAVELQILFVTVTESNYSPYHIVYKYQYCHSQIVNISAMHTSSKTHGSLIR